MSVRKYSFLIIVSAVIIAADQITKLMVEAFLSPNSSITIIDGLLNLQHVRNPGGAFGFLSRTNSSATLTFFLIVSAASVALIIYFFRKAPTGHKWYRSSLAFILGGAVGNLIDRIRLGQVIDFMDIHVGGYHWPAFNIADASITSGGVMLLLSLLRPTYDNSTGN